jgi:hypothetical protein
MRLAKQRRCGFPNGMAENDGATLMAGSVAVFRTLEITEELFVAKSTIKSRITKVLSKLGDRDRVQLVTSSYESGLVQQGGNET